MKAKHLSAITLSLIIPAASLAYDSINGDTHRKKVDITQTQTPKPAHMVGEPGAEDNTATGALTITLDANCYSDYIITLSSGYANVDYYPTSATTVFPASSLAEITYIYIDSDECGTYEGVLDMNEIGNTY